jgi:NADH-quinone oxidoreductase subunit L
MADSPTLMSLWLVPFVSAAGAAITGLFGGRWMGRTAAAVVGCGAAGVSVVLAAVSFARLHALSPPRVHEESLGIWIPAIPLDTSSGIGMFSVNWAARLDPFGSVVLLMVAGAALVIQLRAAARAGDTLESGYATWFGLLGLLSACILLLVVAGNFLVMIAAWEGMGLCLYALINSRHAKAGVGRARWTLVLNGVGTICVLLAGLVVFYTFGTLDFREVANDAGAVERETLFGPLSAIALLLCAAVAATSSQVLWVPRAGRGVQMVRDIPDVLVASTTLIAGVYIVARNAVLFEQAPFAVGVIAIAALAGGATLAIALARRHRR